MVDITEISAMVAAAGVLIGVVFTVLQLRDLVKTRQTDLVIRLSSTIDNKEFAEAMTKIVTTDFKDYRELNDTISAPVLIMIGNFYERVGALLRRKLVNIDLIYDTMLVTPFWERMKPWIVYGRKEFDLPELFENFEYLYNEMKKREQKLQQSKA